MKKVIFCAAFLVSSFAVNAQQIQLDEVKVLFKPQAVEVKADYNNSSFKVQVLEAFKGEFHRDPIAFMKRNLDVSSFIKLSDKKSQPFSVTFKTDKGELVANFNEEGELINTRQNYNNVILPQDLKEELYREYKGWAMVKNKYVAKGNSSSLEKQAYHIKLKKGNSTKKIVINKDDQDYALAMN